MIDANNVANYIKDFFINIGPKLATNCKKPWKFYGDESVNIIDNISTMPAELLSIFKWVNIIKALCIENIPTKF